MNDRILTLHPDKDKRGMNINRKKYEQVRRAIVAVLGEQCELTFTELGNQVEARLAGQFEGSIRWYYTTVKLDLEARGIIERTGRKSPQRVRLAKT